MKAWWMPLLLALVAAQTEEPSRAICPCQPRWELYNRYWYGCTDFSEGTWCAVDTSVEGCAHYTSLRPDKDNVTIDWAPCEKSEITCEDGSTGSYPTIEPWTGPCEQGSCNWQYECQGGLCFPLEENDGIGSDFACTFCPDGTPYPCDNGALCLFPFQCTGGFCNSNICGACEDGSAAPCPAGNTCSAAEQCQSNVCAGFVGDYRCVECSDGSAPPCVDDSVCYYDGMCQGGICNPEEEEFGTCSSCSDGSAAPCGGGDTCFTFNHCTSQNCNAASNTCAGSTNCPCAAEWSIEGLWEGARAGSLSGCVDMQDGYAPWCLVDPDSFDCGYYEDPANNINWTYCELFGEQTGAGNGAFLQDTTSSYDYDYYDDYTLCESHDDCARGEYCDEYMTCYTCSYFTSSIITQYGCDVFDRECCSSMFITQCPADPFQCGDDLVEQTSSPTDAPTAEPTKQPTPQPTYSPTPGLVPCADMMVDGEPWHDNGGVSYSCEEHYNTIKTCNKDGHKYAYGQLVANEACCFCKNLLIENAGGGGACVDELVEGEPWHDSGGPKYTCEAHYTKPGKCEKDGGKYEWGEHTANTACCACKVPVGNAPEVAECAPDFEWAHSSYKDTCLDYLPGGKSHEFWCEKEVVANCCTCPAQEAACQDVMVDGVEWHDVGGEKYSCPWYSKKTRCAQYGDKYPWNDITANEACCGCGGGEVGVDLESFTKSFKYHKHLLDGYELFFSPDHFGKKARFALLAKPGVSGWVSLGFSSNGLMARADAVVGWIDSDSGEGNIQDYYIANQSPSGVTVKNRQGISNAKVFTQEGGRLGIMFERPYTPPGGGQAVLEDMITNIIYASGKISKACPYAFCAHSSDSRYMGKAMLAASFGSGLNLQEINLSEQSEPCHGPQNLQCQPELTCFHPAAADQFAFQAAKTGVCVSADDLGQEDDETEGVQTIFADEGGFDNKKILKGGFVLLWKVNNRGGFDDTITVTLISTAPNKQGWVGFAFSPTGGMAGSDAVVGWARDGNGHIGDYFLKEQLADGVVEADRQELEDKRIISKNGQTAIQFERKLYPLSSVHVIPGTIPIIYGAGPLPPSSSAPLGYHKFRESTTLAFLDRPGIIAADLNAAGNGELCGQDYPNCKRNLVCIPFPSGTAQSGYLARGVCLAESQQDDKLFFENYDPEPVIDVSLYDNKLRLEKHPRPIYLYWSIINDGKDVKIAIVSEYKSTNYLSLAFSPGGGMIGSHAVVGWDGGEESTYIGTYYLEGKSPFNIQKSTAQNAQDLEVRRLNGHTALLFTRPIDIEDGSAPSILREAATSIVYAVGPLPLSGLDFGYHKYRFMKEVRFLGE